MMYNTSVDWHQQSLCISEENLGILPGGVIQSSASLSLRSPTCLPFTVTAAQRLFLLLQLQGARQSGGWGVLSLRVWIWTWYARHWLWKKTTKDVCDCLQWNLRNSFIFYPFALVVNGKLSNWGKSKCKFSFYWKRSNVSVKIKDA